MKKKLMKDKDCHCPYTHKTAVLEGDLYVATACRYGECTILRCPSCGMTIMDWGPVFCRHKNQWYRQLIYPEMAPRDHHFYPKGSTMRKRKQPRK